VTDTELIKELATEAKGISILYVEDDPSIQMTFGSLFKTIFSDISLANNGREGLELYKSRNFDIIISDIQMPEMDGIEMCTQIKEINNRQNIIITSAFEESRFLLKLIHIGIDNFIPKPPERRLLFNALLKVCQNINNEKEVITLTEQLKATLVVNQQLLKEYKHIVDESSIVSKTDLDGVITYVNDYFCETSGYTRSELIGKDHNIMRHPDMPAAVFKEMWSTIQSKKTWKGIVKNLQKNGEAYYSNATVMPILSTQGEIEEYIALRYDITPVIELNKEIEETQHEILYRLGELGESRSKETGYHVRRVAEFSRLLATKYGLDASEANQLYAASPMHDIGKIAIPDAILLKPGKLDSIEFEEMKRHAVYGYEIFRSSKRKTLQTAAIIAHEHHEKYNGKGYPRGLKGEDIHIYGRIVALADVFDALSCARVYKAAWPMEEVLAFLKKERGEHFDPILIDIFLENLDEFLAIKERLTEPEIN